MSMATSLVTMRWLSSSAALFIAKIRLVTIGVAAATTGLLRFDLNR